ncbi:MAG: SPFH domain-containing protein [Bacteriovoracaceae bacterium]|jgi:membrane protease subunit (stomatin/prohibitin family)|nr:SPFH domain-containing protein [Bacteriovoracaceae bacterium]
MGIFDILKKQFIDVIEWTEEGDNTLVYKYPMQDQEIQNGGQLTVREGQLALFINEGEVADVFEPGLHTLNTQNLPILTTVHNWDKAFNSPFKSDVYYFVTRDQIDQRWGTTNPITIRDKDYGHIRLRAHGTFSYKISKPQLFYKKVSGTRDHYTVEELDGQIRSIILTKMSSFFGQSEIPFLDMAANQTLFSEKMKEALEPTFEEYGLGLQTFNVQNLSLPEELQQYLDKASKMKMVGDLKSYASFEAADNIGTAAANEGGAAGMGMGLGAGMAMGQQMMGTMSQATQGSDEEDEDILATIEKLFGMKEKGILSEDEFNIKKEELLKKLK